VELLLHNELKDMKDMRGPLRRVNQAGRTHSHGHLPLPLAINFATAHGSFHIHILPQQLILRARRLLSLVCHYVLAINFRCRQWWWR